jgi:hypothetical protein
MAHRETRGGKDQEGVMRCSMAMQAKSTLTALLESDPPPEFARVIAPVETETQRP